MQDFKRKKVFAMGLSKTEIDLIRLLEAASRQQNQTKLVHKASRRFDRRYGWLSTTAEGKQSLNGPIFARHGEELSTVDNP
nr:PREDICTED: uncharacterized protein LOC103994168 isoform X4 [Musa acuminata subsp. malaccensis]